MHLTVLWCLWNLGGSYKVLCILAFYLSASVLNHKPVRTLSLNSSGNTLNAVTTPCAWFNLGITMCRNVLLFFAMTSFYCLQGKWVCCRVSFPWLFDKRHKASVPILHNDIETAVKVSFRHISCSRTTEKICWFELLHWFHGDCEGCRRQSGAGQASFLPVCFCHHSGDFLYFAFWRVVAASARSGSQM